MVDQGTVPASKYLLLSSSPHALHQLPIFGIASCL
jgi:hypothetical protein